MRPIRSLLFAPGNRPDLLRKFVRYNCDAYVIDLEDATPAEDKANARAGLADAVRYLRDQSISGRLFVRTNETASPHFEADLSVSLAAPIDGIMLPKLASLLELRRVDDELDRAAATSARRLELIGLIETAAGMMNVETLAMCGSPHLSAIAFGAEDFITDMGGIRTADGLEVLYARSRLVLAARAAGITALDQVFIGIKDDDGFRRDARLARTLGYTGKLCVTPRQAALANEIFSPSEDEIFRSHRVIAAYQAAKANGFGAIECDGALVDEPMLKRAEAVVAMAARSSSEA